VDGENFAAAPVIRILMRHPDVVLAVVYAVPDPVTGDQVMAALQLRPGAVFDPGSFAAFLAAQPDMGTKWVPRFIRVSDALPTTATSKILTRALRAERWRCPDQVWWSPDRPAGATYRVLGPSDAALLDGSLAGRPGAPT
jgi:fatty-acyl-CoA synthase